MAAVMTTRCALALAEGDASVMFGANGGRMLSLSFDGYELLRTNDRRNDVWFGGFIMAPWSGVLPESTVEFEGERSRMPQTWGEYSLHGLVRSGFWEIEDGRLETKFPKEWPFGGSLRLEPILTPDSLVLKFTLTAGERRMPAAIGFHPWFANVILGGSQLSFGLPEDASQRELGDAGDPTGRWIDPTQGPWDDCFETGLPFELRWAGAGTLAIRSSGAYVGVFNGEDSGTAIEPMTSAPGAMSDVLEPGESLTLEVRLDWSKS
jgi:galactose mutarotase-like enzyme